MALKDIWCDSCNDYVRCATPSEVKKGYQYCPVVGCDRKLEVFSIEEKVDYVLDCLQALKGRGYL